MKTGNTDTDTADAQDQASLQRDPDCLADWEDKWLTSFHPHRCKAPTSAGRGTRFSISTTFMAIPSTLPKRPGTRESHSPTTFLGILPSPV